MKLQTLILFMSLWLFCLGCENGNLENFTVDQINTILANVNEEDPEFVKKDVSFDSIVTLAGTRTLGNQTEQMKARLYYFDSYTRGYFNLSDRDEKNLQVFGRKINDLWAFKCVTKINMEEVGGYMIMDNNGKGIWSNGHVNFQKGTTLLKKQHIDYDDLKSW